MRETTDYIDKENQIERLQEINDKTHYNLVYCGKCGITLIVLTAHELVKCDDCGFHSEQCDFPDIVY